MSCFFVETVAGQGRRDGCRFPLPKVLDVGRGIQHGISWSPRLALWAEVRLHPAPGRPCLCHLSLAGKQRAVSRGRLGSESAGGLLPKGAGFRSLIPPGRWELCVPCSLRGISRKQNSHVIFHSFSVSFPFPPFSLPLSLFSRPVMLCTSAGWCHIRLAASLPVDVLTMAGGGGGEPGTARM